jgi:hypothetical protein
MRQKIYRRQRCQTLRGISKARRETQTGETVISCRAWLRDRDDKPWYPTVRLFNQRQRGEWSEVLTDVAAALQQRSLPQIFKAPASVTSSRAILNPTTL